jgi:diguanylate cyclase (GGDEF)-like protein
MNTPSGEVITITISLGIAELSQTKDCKLETLIGYSDQALYTAKREGRNHFFVYERDQQALNCNG